MIRVFLSKAARVSQVITGAGCLALSVRLTAVAFAPLFEPSDARPAARTLPEPKTDAPVRVPPPETNAASPAPVDSGPSLRLTLSVTAGPPRSPVYVNGRHVGETPFVGDVSCKGGQPVKVEIVPSREPLIRFLRTCRGGTVRLTEPDLPGIESR